MLRVCRRLLAETEAAEATAVLGEARMMMVKADDVSGGHGVWGDGPRK